MLSVYTEYRIVYTYAYALAYAYITYVLVCAYTYVLVYTYICVVAVFVASVFRDNTKGEQTRHKPGRHTARRLVNLLSICGHYENAQVRGNSFCQGLGL